MAHRPLRPTACASAILAAALFCAWTGPLSAADDEKPKLQPTTSLGETSTPKDETAAPETDAEKPAVVEEEKKKLEDSPTMKKPVDSGSETIDYDGAWSKIIKHGFGPMFARETAPSEDGQTPPQAKKQVTPPSPEKRALEEAVIAADQYINQAPNEEERSQRIAERMPQVTAKLEENPPQDIPRELYRRARTEVADAMVRLGNHKSTPEAKRRDILTQSVTLADSAVRDGDPSGETYRDALNIRAQSNLGLGRYQPAIDDATTVARIAEDDQRAYTTRALAYYQMGQYNQAMEDAKRALRLNPNNTTAFRIAKLSSNRLTTPKDLKLDRMARAAAEQIDREYEAMEEERTQAERVLPKTATASARRGEDRVVDSLNTQALSFTRSGKHQAAFDAYSQVLSKDPENMTARQQRGRTATIMGRYQDAVEDASSLLAKNPDQMEALLMRSRALTQLGRFEEAKRDADRAIGLDGRSAPAYKLRGRAKENLGDLPGMIADFRRAAALDPAIRQELLPVSQNYGFQLDSSARVPAARQAPAGPSAEGSKSRQRRRFLVVLGSSISGGLLIAVGVLQLFVSTRRERRRRSAVIASAGDETNQALEAGGELEGGFKILRVLGNGGMGIVYEAQDKALDRRVAIKKMREEIQQDERERARFLQEARLVAKLHHPNIVDIHSIIEDSGELYLVFEHVDGETLDQVMNRKKRLSVKEAQYIFRGVCHALEYAHHKAVIHRDLKPSNIMITTEGRVKVMDFGIARQAKDAMLKSTKTNHVAGTPQYMAPEQEEGTVRTESDIFSLGACLYEVLTGERPFNGPSTTASKVNKRYTRACRVRKELPAEIDKLIDDALEPDPDKRVRSVVEFRARLDAIVEASNAA